VHDVSEGGLAIALAEAAIYSGVGGELDLNDDRADLFGEVGGRVILALPAEAELEPPDGVHLRRVGAVGGETLFGVGLDELRCAWEGG
jgi:phosphoribosylformylglycinamidine (FGAM) synthase-like enzyme